MVSSMTAASSAARATTILNVDPGAYSPATALLRSGERSFADQRLPLSGAQSLGKGVGVELRVRREGQQIARVHIHNNDGAAFFAQVLGGKLLQSHVDRQHQLVAALAVLAAELADDATDGVHLELARAGAAAQRQVVLPLDTVAPDAKTRQLEQRIAVQILLAHRRDITQDMGAALRMRVEAALAHIDADARQVGGVDLDPRDLLPIQQLLHRDGHEIALAPDLTQDALSVLRRNLDDAAEPVEGLLHVGRVLRRDHDPIVLLVHGQRNTVAVDDPTPFPAAAAAG